MTIYTFHLMSDYGRGMACYEGDELENIINEILENNMLKRQSYYDQYKSILTNMKSGIYETVESCLYYFDNINTDKKFESILELKKKLEIISSKTEEFINDKCKILLRIYKKEENNSKNNLNFSYFELQKINIKELDINLNYKYEILILKKYKFTEENQKILFSMENEILRTNKHIMSKNCKITIIEKPKK